MRLLYGMEKKVMAKKTEKELEIQRLDKKTPLQMLWDYVMITVASFVYAVSVSLFLDPNSLAPGGITGVAIILNRLFGIETGTWMLLINIPILEIRTAVYSVYNLLYGNDLSVYEPADTGRSSDHRSFACFSDRKCPDGSIHGLGVQGRIHYGRNRYYY